MRFLTFFCGAILASSLVVACKSDSQGEPTGGATGGTHAGSGGASGKGGTGGSAGAGGTAGSSATASGGAGGSGGMAAGGAGGKGSGGASGSGGSAGAGGKGSGGASGSGGSAGAGGKGSGGSTATSGAGGSPVAGGSGGNAATGGSTGKRATDCSTPLKGDVDFSVPSGLFQDSVQVSLSTTISGAEIRYTTDGKAPTSSSTVYASPIKIAATTRLRAQAFVAGNPSGGGAAALYISSGVSATHDIPVIVLDSYGSGKLPTDDAKRVFVDVAYMAFENGNTTLSTSKPTAVSFAAFHVRGNSSAMMDKVPYRLELRSETGDDRDCPVLGMPADSDWALVGPHADKTLIHNNFFYDLGKEMGMQVPRLKAAEVYVSLNNKPLSADDYQGVYQIVETIKDNKDRLNLKQLDESKTGDDQISGGYIFRLEWMNTIDQPLTCPSGTTKPWNYVDILDPTPVVAKQKDYLTQYVLGFHNALHGSNIADATSGYPKYIETKTWVDQIIVQEFGRNLDAYVRSQYFYKDRDAKINAGPLWDYDATVGVGVSGTGAYANTATDGWAYEANASRMAGGGGGGGGFPGMGGSSSGTADWFPILIADPTFKAQLVARWKELRGGILSDTAVAARVDAVSAGLSGAADRNFKKWNILTKASVNPFQTPTDATWAAQLSSMKTWLQKRAAWLDGQWK